jgi:hypothetical protein
MPWPLRRIVDLFNALAGWYYRRKYEAAARQLGRPPSEEDGRRGFIVIEIDGLAYEYLRQAMKQGAMPYLARLITGRKLGLARWCCGLPSTTPASQAGIMYGNNWDIPGFRWYNKQTQDSVMCKLPGPVRAIQERISSGRVGLLRGGSSYTNMFDGDARLALFTLSALGRHRVFENVRGLGFLILFALGPVRIIRVLGLSLWTWAVYVVKRTAVFLGLRTRRPHFTFLGPLLEIFNNVIFREVTTFSVMVDVYRGMPSIYAAYTGYDEIAHHFGADSREAFQALRGIDRQIRQIDRTRQLYVRREYDLYILSDHGMSTSIPFRRTYGQTLEEFIAVLTGLDVRPERAKEETEGQPEARAIFLLDELQALEARPHRPVPAQMLRVTREQLEKRLLAEDLEGDWDLSRHSDIVVRNSGSLSHVYFNVAAQPLDVGDVALLYPGILEALAEHEGIALVVGRQQDAVMIMGQSGTLWIGQAGRQLEGRDPLASLPDPDWATRQVARLARFPHSGDLLLLGAWEGARVICFEEQIASHGGLGGPQNWPFIAFPPGQRLSARGIENAEEVYVHLTRTYGHYQ